ncbi:MULTISPECIES: LysR substrate-binding domain-containing protein [Erwiniaceae]|uniref:LysR family transcriptional regulator n=2 Tax=Erwiniaceae TaxID=1903409 RepID=A0ACC5RM12_ENTAG|nr:MULTISPECIES: LysR substrate-binding domain-containing protein [Erwiniaceae]MBK4725744.1 LysR family transcriptional regulator [Pantoea agglomerans]MBP2153521.1 DNA-binding transcriptional LysR family regulator [Erwinia rhapontici]TDS98819.1 DNA-binding transcriptional LysR family regulator [Erwinia rhapontici]UDQ80426.1 LysR family transcriptional regulator [Erwinia rhapontici]BCQ32797.1 cell density-dependent motility repressor [Erwinia rhapontici]
MIGNLEVKWFYDVIALEESRSFTLAAEKRNISQSSFSRRIQSLESALGFMIFDRSKNPLQLTQQGKNFIGYARNMLDDMDFQLNRIKGLDNLRQSIKIDAAPSLSVLWLPEMIAGYNDSNERIHYVESINVNDAVYNLKEGKCDFILSFYNEELMNYPFVHHKIFDSHLHLVTPCDDGGQPLYSLSHDILPLMKYATDSYMGRQVNQVIDTLSEDTFTLRFVSSMSELLKRMIVNGQGVGWLPQYSIKEELSQGKLAIMDPSVSLGISAYVYRSGSRLNLSAERFWQYIRAQPTRRE